MAGMIGEPPEPRKPDDAERRSAAVGHAANCQLDAVGLDTQPPKAIGTQRQNSPLLKLFEGRRVRMSEAVAYTSRHRRDARSDGVQKGWRRRRARAVMPDLQKICSEPRAAGQQPSLGLVLRIAREQERALTPL